MNKDFTASRIPSEDAARLIRAHDGDVALLYIWESVNPSVARNYEKAAGDLCMTIGDVEAGFEKLDRLGISPVSGTAAAGNSSGMHSQRFIPPQEELPDYPAEDIQKQLCDPDFKEIVNEANSALGRILNTPELVKLFAVYDHLKLPKEVIFTLLHFCAEITREKYGPSRKTSIKLIEKEAFFWVNNDIVTLDAAEEYIFRRKKLSEAFEKIKTRLGITGRELTDSEKRYISGWIELGYDEDCIYEAYDRTVTKTGALKWPYMDKIIQTWNEKGFKTMSEILEKDGRGIKPAPKKGPKRNGPSEADYKAAREMMEKAANNK